MSNYLSVCEYATALGISQQAVYKRISKKKLEYIERFENGKRVKYILVEQPIKPVVKPVENVEDNKNSEQFNSTNSTNATQPVEQPVKQLENELTAVIQLMRSQLDIKDKQIERLQAQIARQAEENAAKDKTIKEALEKAQTLQAQMNVLLLESTSTTESKEAAPAVTIEETKDDTVKVKSFFSRFFKR